MICIVTVHQLIRHYVLYIQYNAVYCRCISCISQEGTLHHACCSLVQCGDFHYFSASVNKAQHYSLHWIHNIRTQLKRQTSVQSREVHKRIPCISQYRKQQLVQNNKKVLERWECIMQCNVMKLTCKVLVQNFAVKFRANFLCKIRKKFISE